MQRCATLATYDEESSFFSQAEAGIRDLTVTGVQTCALPISEPAPRRDGRLRDERGRHVGRGDQNDALVRLEAVHLDEELVQGLLTLVVAAAEAGTPMEIGRASCRERV